MLIGDDLKESIRAKAAELGFVACGFTRADAVPDAYQRYLVHGFRAAWPFSGSPLRLKFTARGSKR